MRLRRSAPQDSARPAGPRRSDPYRETFRRHRIRFSVPVVVAVVFAAWFSLGSAPSYRSTASLWVDNGPAEGSSLYTMSAAAAAAAIGDYGATEGPANFEQTILKELLQTPVYDLAVAEGSTLPNYLASGAKSGFSPSTLMNRPHGSPQDQAAAAIASGVTGGAAGPQVLELAYNGPTPAVARSVLASAITQLKDAAPGYSNQFAAQEENYFQGSAILAARAVANAQASLADYKSQHPYANSGSDTIYAALTASVKTNKAALASATAAAQSTTGAGPGLKATISVIDSPSLPAAPVVSASGLALGLLGGLFAGLLIAFLAVYAATPDTHPRWDDELSNARWLRLRWETPRRPGGRSTSRRTRPGGGVA
jgi:hypothetical protein